MNNAEFEMLKALPPEAKVLKSLLALEQFIYEVGRYNIYQSFSGGIDSIITAHLLRQVDPHSIPLVFSDTGLEFQEIRELVFSYDNVEVIKPDMPHPVVIERYGYPVISKDISGMIYKLKNHNLSERYRNYLLHGDERGKFGTLPARYHYLLDAADFKIGDGCCAVMKKRPFYKYAKRTGRYAFITGETAEESRRRKLMYMRTGCNAFDRKGAPKSTPLGPWTKNDRLWYIKHNNLLIPKVYGDVVEVGTVMQGSTEVVAYDTTGYKRTGCVFCAYGAHREGEGCERFKMLAQTHPKLYDYCMRGGRYNEKGLWVPHQGLGMAHVLDTINIAR